MDKIIDEIQTQTLQISAYSPDRPKQMFQFYHPQHRKQFINLMNLSRLWLESVLYYKRIYPQQAFQTRTAWSRHVKTIKSKSLRLYLDEFFETLSQNIEHATYLEVHVFQIDEEINKQILIEVERFEFKLFEKGIGRKIDQIKQDSVNCMQKQIQYKRFLTKIQNDLQKGYECPLHSKCSFKLFMGYKWTKSQPLSRHKANLLQKWSETEQLKQENMSQNIIDQSQSEDGVVTVSRLSFCRHKK